MHIAVLHAALEQLLETLEPSELDPKPGVRRLGGRGPWRWLEDRQFPRVSASGSITNVYGFTIINGEVWRQREVTTQPDPTASTG
jgi:hypothetical protein